MKSVSWGQVTLLSPTGDGGFETGTTFAENGWIATTGTSTQNQWTVNTGATGLTGMRCAYVTDITTNVPPPNSYNINSARVSHLYRNVSIPCGATSTSLTFNWKALGESCCDYLRVWLIPSTITPVYGTQLVASGTAPTGNIQVGQYNNNSAWQSVTYSVPAAYSGVTFRLVFEWRNDGSIGSNPPAAIDNIGLTYVAQSAPSITSYTPTNLCSGGGQTVTITGTNLSCTSGVTFNGQAAASYNNVNSTTITAVTPVGVSAGLIEVTTIAGTATSSAYTVTPSPTTVTVNTSGSYCVNTTLTASNGSSGIIYWQNTTSNGTSTATQSTSQVVSSNGTYYFRALSGGCWSTQGAATITIVSTVPAQPSTISGTANVCSGNSQVYSVTNVAGVTYNWNLPSGWSQTAGGTSNSITVTTGSTGGTISVTPSNACGNGTIRSLTVTTTISPTNTACSLATSLPCGTSNMAGSTICTPGIAHGLPYAYNAGTVSNYGSWYVINGDGVSTTVSVSPTSFDVEIDVYSGSCGSYTYITGMDINGSGGTETVTFTTSIGITYYVYVAYYASSGTASNTGNFTITRTCLLPPSISSLNTLSGCIGEQLVINGANFTGTSAANVKIGGTPVTSIVSNTGSILTVIVGNGTTGVVTVTTANGTGTSTDTYTINPNPAQPGIPISNSPQCNPPGVTITANGSSPSGETWYWQTVSNGILTTLNAMSPYNTSTAGTYYIRSQNGTTGCWSSAASTTITISSIPAQPSTISGSASVCSGSTQTYSITNVAGISYSWSFPLDWVQTGGGSSNSVIVTTGSNSGTISVTPSNACGSGTPRTLSVTVSGSIPSNDPCSNAITLTIGAAASTGTLSCASPEAPFATYKDVWYSFTPTCNGTNTVTLTGFAGDKDLYIYTFCNNNTSLYSSAGSSATESVTNTFIGGQTYFIRVLDYNNNANTSFTIRVTQGATTATTPTDINGTTSVCPSSIGNVYSVTNVTGTTYNWTIPSGWEGSTTSNTITLTAGTGGGTLSVTATNSCGTSTASLISLSVRPLPIVSAGNNTAICIGNNTTLNGITTPPITTLFSENFEGNTSSWNIGWFSGDAGWNTWEIWTTNALSGTYSAMIRNDWTSTHNNYDRFSTSKILLYNQNIINAIGFSGLSLSFKWKANGEAGYDFGRVAYSYDGLAWNFLPTQYNGQGTTQTATVDLSFLNGQQFYLGFRWDNDASGGSQPPMSVDDILITAIPTITNGWTSNPLGFSSTSLTPTVSPSTTTTYTLSATANGCTASSNVVITVNPEASASITSPSSNVCVGQQVGIGGNVTATGAWTLTLSNGQTTTGTGNGFWNINAIPSATTTYSISSIVDAAACPTTLTGSTNITLPTQGTSLGVNDETATCVVNQNGWVHFYETATGDLLASVNSNGQNLGNVTVISYVDGSPALVPACDYPTNQALMTSVMERHWVITPTFQPITPVQVRLPFYDSEFSTLMSAANSNANIGDNLSIVSELKLSKYSGPNNVDNDALNNCASYGGNGGTTLHNQIANGTTSTYASNINAANFTDFTIPGFSEFWLHANNNNSPLPVELVSFQANCVKGDIQITWSTASEHNSTYFTIEKSRDGIQWDVLIQVDAAGISSSLLSYEVTDVNTQSNIIYYRLKQIDVDGSINEFGIVSINCSNEQTMELKVIPNPNDGDFYLEFNGEESITYANILIIDTKGSLISTKPVNIEKGNNVFQLNESNIEPGMYYIQLVYDDFTLGTVKFLRR